MCQNLVKSKVPAQISSGDNRTRTCDPLHVKQMLSQLSYVSNNNIDYTTSGRFYKQKIFRIAERDRYEGKRFPVRKKVYSITPSPFPTKEMKSCTLVTIVVAQRLPRSKSLLTTNSSASTV